MNDFATDFVLLARAMFSERARLDLERKRAAQKAEKARQAKAAAEAEAAYWESYVKRINYYRLTDWQADKSVDAPVTPCPTELQWATLTQAEKDDNAHPVRWDAAGNRI